MIWPGFLAQRLRLPAPLRQLRQNTRGVSAVEFALIVPVMVLVYFACIELSLMMRTDRKVTAAASSLGDLTARLSVVTNNDFKELYAAANVMLQPNGAASARMRLTSVVDNGDGVKRVAWSAGHNIAAHPVGAVISVPNGIVPTPGSVVIAEVQYNHRGVTGIINSSKTLSDVFYLRPRRVASISLAAGTQTSSFGP